MHTKVFSAVPVGVQSVGVEVEVDIALGMLAFMIVGLPDTAIKESRQRIATAIKNSGIRLPERKITINLAPADIKKEGTLLDLPIAIGIVKAFGLVELSTKFLEETLFVGELSLDGTIRGVRGALPIAYDSVKSGKIRLIVARENASQAGLIDGLEVIGVQSFVELIGYLKGEVVIQPTQTSSSSFSAQEFEKHEDFSDVIGQNQAKRMLQIAAAGQHNILFIGSPGCGKSMLSRRITSIMPAMSFDEIIATSKVYSVGGKGGQVFTCVTKRPFRSPHHTVSHVGLVGGGAYPQPGELSLAHNGVLFLDELLEFNRPTLESLRQPLEDREITISRAQYAVTFPANFLLIAALNPCPCGYLGDKRKKCVCSPHAIARYLDKLSGPMIDRFDLQGAIPSIEYDVLIESKKNKALSSATLYEGVVRARERQKQRFGREDMCNGHMEADVIQQVCTLSPAASEIIKKVFEKMSLSMRGYHKILKVARTIADIEGSEIIEQSHIQEAVMYRSVEQLFERR